MVTCRCASGLKRSFPGDDASRLHARISCCSVREGGPPPSRLRFESKTVSAFAPHYPPITSGQTPLRHDRSRTILLGSILLSVLSSSSPCAKCSVRKSLSVTSPPSIQYWLLARATEHAGFSLKFSIGANTLTRA